MSELVKITLNKISDSRVDNNFTANIEANDLSFNDVDKLNKILKVISVLLVDLQSD